MPKHPLDELTFRGGTLTYRHGGPTGPQSYLDTPPVSIVDRDGHRELPSLNQVAYNFKLNVQPDQTWSEFFDGSSRDIDARILGQRLQISCIPANLTSHYTKAKAAMQRANEIYAGHKTALIETVKQLDAQRDQENQVKETHSQTISKQFDDLQL